LLVFTTDSIITQNNISYNYYGVWLHYSFDNHLYHNNFGNNVYQVHIEHPWFGNVWHNGYPSGGNYWSDYTGLDFYSGPHQNEIGSDDIGDTSYVIDSRNIDRYPLMNPWVAPDIAIVNVTTSKTIVDQGYPLKVNVTYTKQGNKIEESNSTIYANSTLINSQSFLLRSGTSLIYTFTWNTIGFPKGNYTIKAVVDIVPGETDTIDNILTDGTVLVTIPGDANGDHKCDMKDIFQLILHFMCKIGQPCYVLNYDINCDDVIDMKDIYIAILHFGQRW